MDGLIWKIAGLGDAKEKISYYTIVIDVRELMGLFILLILFGVKGLGFNDGQKPFLLGVLIAILFLVVKVLTDWYSRAELAIWGLWGLLALINYHFSRDDGILLCFMLMLTARSCSLRRICRTGAVIFLGTGFLNIMLSVLGIHEGTVVLHNKLGGEILRYAFGQAHPNVLHTTYVIVCCFLLYLYGESKHCLKWNIILLLGSIVLFVYTISYTGILMSILLFASVMIDRFHCRTNRFDWSLSYGILVGTILYAVALPLFTNLESPFFQNILLSVRNRFILLNAYFGSFGITLFGQKISGILWYQLDTSWAVLFLGGGVLLFGSFVLFYAVGLYCLLHQNRRLEAYMVLVLLLGGLMDPFLFNTSLKNIGLLFMADAVRAHFFVRTDSVICLNRRLSDVLDRKVGIKIQKIEKRTCPITLQAVMFGIALAGAAASMQFISMPEGYVIQSVDDLGECNDKVESIDYSQIVQEGTGWRILGKQSENSEWYLVRTDRIRTIEYGRMYLGIVLVILTCEYGIWLFSVCMSEKIM